MIKVIGARELPYPVACYGCGKKSDVEGIRIETCYTPSRLREIGIYLCSDCKKDLIEKLLR